MKSLKHLTMVCIVAMIVTSAISNEGRAEDYTNTHFFIETSNKTSKALSAVGHILVSPKLCADPVYIPRTNLAIMNVPSGDLPCGTTLATKPTESFQYAIYAAVTIRETCLDVGSQGFTTYKWLADINASSWIPRSDRAYWTVGKEKIICEVQPPTNPIQPEGHFSKQSTIRILFKSVVE